MLQAINQNKGFSLLEILVAFSIMAISLGILLKIFSSGVNTAVIAEEYIVATQIAESLMAKTGVEEPLAVGRSSGTEAEKYQWKVRVERVPDPLANEKEVVEFMEIQVKVEWGDNDYTNRVVELNTVKAGQRL